MPRAFRLLAPLLGFVALLTGCESPRYDYHYIPGRTATLRDGVAIAPPAAPSEVHAAVAAANRIAGLPYTYGGGHRVALDTGYDCSGAASYVLGGAGVLSGTTTSRGFRRYGQRGEGEWISIYARRGHVFLVVAGLRYDTGYSSGAKGPHWTTESRPADGAVIRHPRGL